MTCNYPEWRCYRDIIFWFKFLSNPCAQVPACLPDQKNVALLWKVRECEAGPLLEITAFGNQTLSAKPDFETAAAVLSNIVCEKKRTRQEQECDILEAGESKNAVSEIMGLLDSADSDTLLAYLSVDETVNPVDSFQLFEAVERVAAPRKRNIHPTPSCASDISSDEE